MRNLHPIFQKICDGLIKPACEHQDRDGHECLDCGADVTEWLASRVDEDAGKDCA